MIPELHIPPNDASAAHPLSELLACPPAAGNLLTTSARNINFLAGETIFRQRELSQGLYLIVTGQLLRRAHRRDAWVVLGMARPGELVELAAVLGDRQHTFSLIGHTAGSLLLVPFDPLQQAFRAYPPMRLHLLAELAREVSRAYRACTASAGGRPPRRSSRQRPAAG
jgi:CRP-like cAMP-binding protein